ncbi:PHB depolymerase family esterase [Mesorhizobium sp. INR15]|uniref:extracellular catalytic domain type 1 short-chain-length polyhydroxyalkanoate depolymerase n=1 Tax=Mesorhizobium sp. INR15 TaxID=2654248 RepID=UPI0018967536|nr:PHB depolymerase family esterase [Mesorhizobium sp. INR15]QPC95808.1 PHB depolymerase family esterase [Mesorhizobium sp. INR15]
MRSMSDTIARLSAFRKTRGAGLSPWASDRLSEIQAFGSNPGQLRGWSYCPNNLAASAPLVVVLHGCTQTAASYDYGSGWSRRAELEGFAVLFPEQQRNNNPNLCFNWFVPEDTRRGSGEALSIRQMVETMISAHDLDRRRVFITGLSAGGAMTSVMLSTYPEVFSGGAIIAGLPYGIAGTMPQAFDAMRGHRGLNAKQLASAMRGASDHSGPWPKISIWHGNADATVSPVNSELIAAQWLSAHGVTKAQARREDGDGFSRSAWEGASGDEVVEFYNIAGMAHGAPIDTSDGFSNACPFMLDVGISSTGLIARSWGIAVDRPGGRENLEMDPGPDRFRAPMGDRRRPTETSKIGPGKVIEDALRAAGLMK